MKTALAADLGGTKCRFALVAEDFSVHRVQQFATVRDRPAFLDRMQAAVAAVLQDLPAGLARPDCFGVGTAGTVPVDGRSVHEAPNLPLDGFALAEHLEQRFGCRVIVLNDGRASAWGEYLRGEARGADPLLCLFFGTGIGIGLMVGGRPFAGAANAAGEIGHTLHVPGGRRCACGRAGHFEAYCGGRAITERAAAEIGPRPDGSPWTVGEVVRNDGAAARRILAEARTAATVLVVNACTLLNPAAVVLGGGVLSGWPALRQDIARSVAAECSRPIVEAVRLVPSRGGSDAILWGAAAAAGLWQG